MQGKSRRDDGVFYIFYAEICQAVHEFLTITWSLDQGMFWILVLVNYEQLHIDRRCPSIKWSVAFKKVLVPCTCVYFWIYNPFVFCTFSLLSPCVLLKSWRVQSTSSWQRWLQLIPPIWPWRSLGPRENWGTCQGNRKTNVNHLIDVIMTLLLTCI